MNKSRFVLIFLTLSLLLTISLTYAGTSDDATKCLNDKITEKTCSKLTAEEQIFSLLAVSKCETELLANSRENQCWPLQDCSVKTTSQAVFALSSIKTEDAVNWLLTQTKSSTELIWYLQIDAASSTCKITYDGQTSSTNIDENGKLSSNVGACLVRAYDDYWLEVEKNCYNKDISISCNEPFSTTLLYKKQSSSTIYLSGETQYSSTDGTITEKIDSLCFAKSGFCDYESTSWAVLTLKNKNIDVSAYIPYLVVMADENKKSLPDSFLYLITKNSDYYNNLLAKQKTKYWEESGDKYYDTAVALFALQNDNSPEKTNSLTWLLSVQDKDGCWRGSISETAFLLFAGWSGAVIDTPITNGPTEELQSCSELKGEICSSNKNCDSAEPKSSDGWCCLGNCKKTIPSEPEIPTPSDNGKSYWYVWVLLVLIVLAIVGIIFRDKLRVWYFRMSSGFGKGSYTSSRPLPPGSSYTPRPLQRRMIPPSAPYHSPVQSRPKNEMEKEFSDVLKKLKDISS